MRIVLEWLEELVSSPVPVDELAALLTAAGLEVEGVEESRLPDGVAVGEVVSLRPHPSGDRLHVCRVSLGAGEDLEVVCGAPNVAERQRVAIALPGAILPGGVVAQSEIRGVTSAGVLCSERELGLSDDHGGILVLAPGDALGDDALPPPGARLGDLLPPTAVLDVSLTPNRGDCASVLGIAREVSALCHRAPLATRPLRQSGRSRPAPEPFSVEIEDRGLCSWYCGQRFTVDGERQAPLWMRRRLALAGVRSISAVVDVTNYVMLERGQPLHAFDQDRLRGHALVVRRARAGEALTLLDGSEPALGPEDLVIADAEGPVALAGVMGGASSEVGPATRRIVLESAIFQPSTVRRTARRLAKQTEASFRFERQVDPSGAAAAVARAASLLEAVGATRVGRMIEAGAPAPAQPAIAFSPAWVNRLLGTAVADGEMVARLRALGVAVRRGSGGRYAALPPPHRSDLGSPADLAEEVARVGGYGAIPTTRPRVPALARQRPSGDLAPVRAALVSRGFAECVPLAFAERADNERFPGLWGAATRPLVLQNPLASVASEMRRSLLPGLLGVLRTNQSRGETFVPLFASGAVFALGASGETLERRGVALLTWGTPPAAIGRRAEPLAFADVKHVVEGLLAELRIASPDWRRREDLPALHPGRAAELRVGDAVLGLAGQLHPALGEALGLRPGETWLVELDLAAAVANRKARPRYAEPPKFPAVLRDVALVVADAVPAGQVLAGIRAIGHPLVENVSLFDEYTGPGIPAGKKSLAYALSYRAPDRTLTDAEVNSIHEEILRKLAQTIAFTRRGEASADGVER